MGGLLDGDGTVACMWDDDDHTLPDGIRLAVGGITCISGCSGCSLNDTSCNIASSADSYPAADISVIPSGDAGFAFERPLFKMLGDRSALMLKA